VERFEFLHASKLKEAKRRTENKWCFSRNFVAKGAKIYCEEIRSEDWIGLR